MKYKNALGIAVVVLLPLILLIISCRKDGPLDQGDQDNGIDKETVAARKMSTACTGSELKQYSYAITYEQSNLNYLKIIKITQHFCDNIFLRADSVEVANTYITGVEAEAGTETPAVFQYTPPRCGSGVIFDLNNIYYYNSSVLDSRPTDVEVMEKIYAEVLDFEYYYSGSYVLADLDMYGYGSKKKLQEACFGYIATHYFGYNKFVGFVNNVPALSSGTNSCDELRYKNACLFGAQTSSLEWYNFQTMQEVYNYFLDKIAYNQM